MKNKMILLEISAFLFFLVLGIYTSIMYSQLFSVTIFLEFFVGLAQIIGSVIRYISAFNNSRTHTTSILWYWLIVMIYFTLLTLSYNLFDRDPEINIMNIGFNLKSIRFNLAWFIAVWYLFHISFLKPRSNQ
jgi:Ca2+/H+ antiporter